MHCKNQGKYERKMAASSFSARIFQGHPSEISRTCGAGRGEGDSSPGTKRTHPKRVCHNETFQISPNNLVAFRDPSWQWRAPAWNHIGPPSCFQRTCPAARSSGVAHLDGGDRRRSLQDGGHCGKAKIASCKSKVRHATSPPLTPVEPAADQEKPSLNLQQPLHTMKQE